MGRLVTSGFEFQAIDDSAGGRVEDEVFRTVGTPSIDTTIKRSGVASLKCPTGAARYVRWNFVSPVLDRDYFARVYVRMSGNPGAVLTVLRIETTLAVRQTEVRIGTDGTLSLRNAAGTIIGSASSALALNTWHRIELKCRIVTGGGANSTAELRLNGVTVASSATADLGSTAPGRLHVGAAVGTAHAITDLNFDDVAVNDDQGSDENSWCGPGTIVLLKPVSDFARGADWLNGANGTTNLWDAVDNRPPVGVAVGSATATSQIRDAVSPTIPGDDLYTAETETYASAGIVSTDRIKVVQGVAVIGSSTTTSLSVDPKLDGNPSGSEVVGATTGTTAAGTYPVGWRAWRTDPLYAPSLILSSGAQVRLNKNTNSTDEAMSCLLGVYVEYEPSQLGSAAFSGESSFSGAGIRNLIGSATFSGEGDFISSGIRALYAAAALSGQSDLVSQGVRALFASGTFSGQSDLTAVAVRNLLGSAALSGEGVLTAVAIRNLLGAAALAGEGTLLAAAMKISFAAAALSGMGTLTASPGALPRWDLTAEQRWAAGADTRWPASTDSAWVPAAGERWPASTDNHWN